ncbi:hypothetical protein VNO80_26194 [Phaseolus coccineus]|uniref:Uncharacterized protein n=1 Tax=Phaseolus coccineus TaxID=3886 RepID=A0AAN9LEB8_PHACN
MYRHYVNDAHVFFQKLMKVINKVAFIAEFRVGGYHAHCAMRVEPGVVLGHGASQQKHPHYNSHTLMFARQHTTRQSTPASRWQPTKTFSLQLTHPRVCKTPHHENVHHRLPLASEQMETSSDPMSASLGMEKNNLDGNTLCQQTRILFGSQQKHPHCDSLTFARHHTTRQSTPRLLLASEQMETSSDPVSESLGMEKSNLDRNTLCQQTWLLFEPTNKNILITTHTPSRSQDTTPPDGPSLASHWQHGASEQKHPHYNSHTLTFARHHTTRQSTPNLLLASEKMEISSDPVSASLGRQHMERDCSAKKQCDNKRDACLTVRCMGHGASQQKHPHYNSHTLTFARHHSTRQSISRLPLASEQMETSSDPMSASLGMEKNNLDKNTLCQQT